MRVLHRACSGPYGVVDRMVKKMLTQSCSCSSIRHWISLMGACATGQQLTSARARKTPWVSPGTGPISLELPTRKQKIHHHIYIYIYTERERE